MQTRSICLFVDEPDRDDEDEEDEDVDEEEEDDDDEFCSLMFGDFELFVFVFVVVRSDVLDESSCFTSRRAASPMLSLVMTRLSISSEPSAVAMAI